jgi:FkbM family methyltransferase
MKKFVYKCFVATVDYLVNLFPFWLVGDELMMALKKRVVIVKHEDQDLFFYCPTRITNLRAKTFSIKEPLTLKWIDGLSPGSVLWDIGANIGLYSIYAAKFKGIKVISFEPSVFNLELLVRNINLNLVSDLVSVIPLPLYKLTEIKYILLSSENIGAALNTFGEIYGQDGNDLLGVIKYNVLGLSADDLLIKLGINPPTNLKIDVDGIEHLVLAGATKLLESVQSVLVEVNDSFDDQAKGVSRILSLSGFYLHEKQKFGGETEVGKHSNQLWLRG